MLTVFQGYTAPVGEVREAFDFKPVLITSKRKAPIFVMGLFEGNRRSNETIKCLTGCVLDFDNAEGSDTIYQDIKSELDGYEYYAYTTYSNSEHQPRWRLVLPYDQPISPTAHLAALHQAIELVGNPPGIDTCSKVVSQAYIVPGFTAANRWLHYMMTGRGRRWQPDIFTEIDTLDYFERAKPTLGRNQHLSKLCVAMMKDGYHVAEIAEELCRQDQMFNATPYFSDPTENGNIADAPGLNAYNFVLSFARTLKHDCDLPKVFAVRDRDKRRITTQRSETTYRSVYQFMDRDFAACLPGIVGEIARDILGQAIFPNPALAVQAALCIVGTMKTHMIRAESNGRTSIYTIGTALTGKGKDDPQKYIKDCFAKLQSLQVLASQPRSFAGLHSALVRSHCKTICLWDELGSDLQGILRGGNNSWEARTQTELLKLFSSANTLYQTGELQDRKDKVPTPTLNQPGFTIAGFSTPATLFEAIQTTNIRSGLLPRFIYFKCGPPPKRTHKYRGVKVSDHVVDALRGYVERSLYYRAQTTILTGGNSREVGPQEQPKIVPYSDDAFQRFVEIQDLEDEKASRGDIDADIHSRVAELVERVALILCDDTLISLADVNTAFEILSCCQHNFLIDIKRNVAESAFAKAGNKIINFLESEGPKNSRDIQRKIGEDSRKVKSLIEYLINCEFVEIFQIVNSKGRKETKYRLRSNSI